MGYPLQDNEHDFPALPIPKKKQQPTENDFPILKKKEPLSLGSAGGTGVGSFNGLSKKSPEFWGYEDFKKQIPESNDPIGDAANVANEKLDELRKSFYPDFSAMKKVNEEIKGINNAFGGDGYLGKQVLTNAIAKETGKQIDLDNLPLEEVKKQVPKTVTAQKAFEAYSEKRKADDAINTTTDFWKAAVKYELGLNNEQQAGVSQAKAGDIALRFLNNPNVIERTKHDPQFAHDYKQAQTSFLHDFPATAKKMIAQEIGQELENSGRSNWLYNNPEKEKVDKVVDEMVKSGKLSPEKVEIYKNEIRGDLGTLHSLMWGSPIPTTDVTNSLSRGLVESKDAILSSARDLTQKATGGVFNDMMESREDRTKRLEEQEFSTPIVEPHTEGRKILSGIAHFTGFATPMILGELAGVPTNVTMTMMFEGTNADNGAKMFKGDEGKQALYTILGTTIDVLGAKLLPTKEAAKGVTNILKKDIVGVINDLADEKITQAEAKQLLGDKIMKTFGSVAKGNTNAATFSTASQVLHNGLGAALGGRDFNIEDEAKQAVNTFKTSWLSASFLSGLAAKGSETSKLDGKIIRNAAENPDYFKSLTTGNKNETEISANINRAKDSWDEIKDADLTEAQKEKFLVKDLQQKVWEKKAENAKTDVIKEGFLKKAQELKTEKEKIYKGEDKAPEHQSFMEEDQALNEKEQAAVDAIKEKDFENTGLKLYVDVLKDENATPKEKREALKGISDQYLAKGTTATTGEALGAKASKAIEDLGHEAPQESEAVNNILEPKDESFPDNQKIRVSAQQLEERQPSNIRQRYLDDFNIVESSAFDWRVTSSLSSKDRLKAVQDIKDGKDSAAAKKLEQEVKEMIDRGTVIINRGRGNAAQTVEIPIDEWFQFTPIEHEKIFKAADEIDDFTTSIIRDNDITLQNIDDLKHLFNGFPYDPEHFTAVKDYLSGQSESGNQTGNAGKESNTAKEEIASSPKLSIEEPPNKPPEEKVPETTEQPEDFTSIKNETTEEKRKQAGLTPAIEQAERDFGTVWGEAKNKIEKEHYDPQSLVESLKAKERPLTDLEDALLLYHQNTKESQLDAANKDIISAGEKGDASALEESKIRKAKILDDLQDIYNVGKAGGRETARGLNARKMMTDRKYSLVNMMQEKRAANDGKSLTPEQEKEVNAQFEEIKKTNEALQKRVEELENKVQELESKKSIKQKGKDLADKIRKLRPPNKGTAQSNILGLPLAVYDTAIVTIANAVEGGAALIDAIHEAVKDLTFDSDKDKNDFVAHLQVLEKKTPSYNILDKEALRLKANNERAIDAYEAGLKKDQLKNRSTYNKVTDAFVNWERAFKLSGISTLAKLTTAAVTRLTTEPIEEVVGAGYSALIPNAKYGKEVGMEGGINVKALARGYTEALTSGMRDAAMIMKRGTGGKSDLDVVFGRRGDLPPEAINFFGQLHSALKAPVKRFAFERSLQKRLARNINNGVDVSDPMVQTRILMESYKAGQRAIFMQDNFVSNAYRNWINMLEQSKDYPVLGKSAATVFQWMLPFVKVPTNIVGEIGTNVAGVPIGATKIVHTVFTKGLENLNPEERDFIIRNLKKGTIGIGALLLGYYNPQAFGGYYQQGEKRSQQDLKAGQFRVFGMRLPAWLLESPIFQTMQLGATVRRVKDTVVKGEPEGLPEGIWAGSLGLLEHEPLIDQPMRMSAIFKSEKEREYYLGELAKSTVDPAALQNIANWTDDKQRSPKTLLEHIEMGIPGLRQNVPYKRAFTDEDMNLPAFKAFTDKGLSLPYTSPETIEIKDFKTGEKHNLSDYSNETITNYYNTRKEILQSELKSIQSKGYVYVDKFGDVSLTKDKGEEKKKFSDLTKEEMIQILSIAGSEATSKTKKKLFPQ